METRGQRYFTKHKPHTGCRKGQKCRFLSLVTLTFDLWAWPSNLSERGTKHVFRVNLAQIRTRDISYTNKKNTDWRCQKQNLPQFTACGKSNVLCLRVYLTRLTTVLIYVLSCVGMLAFSLTLRLHQIWIVFIFSALLGSVSRLSRSCLMWSLSDATIRNVQERHTVICCVSGLTARTSWPDCFFWSSRFFVLVLFITLSVFLVPFSRLSLLPVSFWVHENIVYRIVSVIFNLHLMLAAENVDEQSDKYCRACALWRRCTNRHSC